MTSLPYSILKQTHPDYDAEKHERLSLLYHGGYDIIKEAHRFIPRSLVEHELAYKEKLSYASYVNYFAANIDDYCANLYEKQLSVLPAQDQTADQSFYQTFSANADLAGSPLSNVLKDLTATALKHGRAYLGIDFPSVDQVPTSLAEEEALQLNRAYLFPIDNLAVLDWQKDAFGSFVWIKLYKEEIPTPTPISPRDQILRTWKLWEMQNGQAKWSTYSILTKKDQVIGDKQPIPLTGEGLTSFREIPVKEFDLPDGLCIGAKIATLCENHYRLRTCLLFGESRSLFPMPAYTLGADIDAGGLPVAEDDASQRKQAGVQALVNKGMMVMGPNDKFQFVEPAGTSYTLINQQLKELADEIYRTVNQMAQSVTATANGVARSAASKVQDSRSKEILLNEYGSMVRQFAVALFSAISKARGESVTWEAKGLNNYRVIDPDRALRSLMQLPAASQAIPSKAFQKALAQSAVKAALPDLTPELENEINQDLETFFLNNLHEPIEEYNDDGEA